jgi:hypothetical protein
VTWQQDLGGAFSDALADGLDLPEPDLGFAENLRRYVAEAGSGRAAARQLGVPESTLRGWRHGTAPRHIHQRQVELVQSARQRATPKAMTLLPGSLFIKAVVKHSNDKRKRIIHPGRVIPQAVMGRLVRDWAAGASDTQLGNALAKAVDTYYQPFQYVRVDEVGFE